MLLGMAGFHLKVELDFAWEGARGILKSSGVKTRSGHPYSREELTPTNERG